MNEKLQEILLNTLEKAQELGGQAIDAAKIGFDKAVDFAKEQIPDIISQLMVWEFSYHAFWAGFWIAFCLILIAIGAICWKWSKKYVSTGRYGGVATEFYVLKAPLWAALFISFVFVLPSGIADNALVCAKIKFAPKVFLIEYCSELLKARQAANTVYRDVNGVERQGYYTPTHNH
jgi:hypothetical protein